MLVIVIGRGRGGTRLASRALSGAGVYMGTVNEAGDMVPPENMYAAARIMGSLVKRRGRFEWDFSEVLSRGPSESFKRAVYAYLAPLMESPEPVRGWKLPETTLAFPWIAKMFPNAYFVHWVRDPRGSVFGAHMTDSLSRFGLEEEREPEGIARSRAAQAERRLESWAYHEEVVRATPRPRRFLSVRFEDFVRDHGRELGRLSEFLGMEVPPVDVDHSVLLREAAPCPDELLSRYGYG